MTKNIKSETSSKKKIRNNKKITDDSSVLKGIGLFDHVKHIKSIQDPEYFNNLSDLDKKSFNHFMIIRALSMNPNLLDDISIISKFYDKIPSAQFYKLLIGLIQKDPKFYPWIKSKKKSLSKNLLNITMKYFEVSNKEAEEYISFLYSTENGKKEIENLCQDFAIEPKEIEKILNNQESEIFAIEPKEIEKILNNQESEIIDE